MTQRLISLRLLQSWKSAVDHENYCCQERCGHIAVCVNDELLIWGGYNDTQEIGSTYCDNSILWSYNFDFDHWICVKTSGQHPINRSGASGALIWPHWYILCGHTYEGNTNEVHRLNLLSLVWEKLNPLLAIAPRDKASTWVYQGRIYIFGGYGTKPNNCLWDEENDKFTQEIMNVRGWNDQVVYFNSEKLDWVLVECKGHRPKGRAAHSTVCVNSTVYVFGGRHQDKRLNDLHCFNLETNTWSGAKFCRGNLPPERSWHSMTAINNSDLIMYGGFSDSQVPLDDLWMLNVQTFTWTLLRYNTGHPRLWHSASLNVFGDILIYGGACNNLLLENERLITSDQVLVIRTKPFTLERLCLHAVFRYISVTREGWENLPRLLKEWLELKSDTTELVSQKKTNAMSLFGPNVRQLTVTSFE